MKLVSLQVDCGQFFVGDFDPRRIGSDIQFGSDLQAGLVAVFAISLMITSWLTSGRPRQFWVM